MIRSSTLRVRDTLIRNPNILLHIKSPKSGRVGGEFLDVFPFPFKDLCPVLALQTHLGNLSARKYPSHLPLFTDDEGYLITVRYVNLTLQSLLKTRVDLQEHSLSAHSFRAGIPSELQRSPDLFNSEDVKGWGRWQSDCHARYKRLNSQQRAKIFSKISLALQPSLADC